MKIEKINRIYKLIFLLLASSFIFTGCWNYNEITDMSIVLGAAIDKNDDDTFTLTMEVVSFNSTSNNTNGNSKQINGSSQIITSTGDTIYEAINNSSNTVGMRTYWNHARIIIVSNKLNGYDFKRVLDCLVRNNETNINTKIFVSQSENAYDIFNASSSFHSFLSFDIYSTLSSNSMISESIDMDLFQLIDEYGYVGSSIALPSLNIVHKDDKDVIVLSGLGIFDKNKFIGFIPENDTMFFLFTINKVNKGEISIKTNDDIESNANLSLRILNSETKIEPKIDQGKFKVNYDIKINFIITGYTGSQDFNSKEDIMQLERASSLYLENNIKKLLNKMQSTFQTDIFYLSKLYNGKYFNEWNIVKQNWNNVFKNIEFSVNVTSKISNTGSIISTVKENY